MPTTSPSKSSLSKWSALPEVSAHSLFHPLAVVTAMTTVGVIVGILALATGNPSKKVLTLCIAIGLLGLVTIIYQMRRLYRLDMARVFISRLLAEGENLSLYIPTRPNAGDNDNLMRDWCKRVEGVLRKYLDESYVTRFHLGGSIQENAESMSVWKARHRLETLGSFLTELGRQ